MVVILIGHRKRQGKDTFARILGEKLDGAIIKHFAFYLKNVIAEMFDISIEELDKFKNDGEICFFGNKRLPFRDILINFGNGHIKEYFGKSVWANSLYTDVLENNSNAKYLIIPDFRYEEEFKFLSNIFDDIITVKVERDFKEADNTADAALSSFLFDEFINNSGTYKDLNKLADRFIEKWYLKS